MSDANALLNAGDLNGARAALVDQVKRAPQDQPARMFLFQLFCLLGEWEKAKSQLRALASLSPEAQRAAEQKLVSQAIDSFRKQAQSAAQGFGYSNFTIREVNVGRSGAQPRPVMMMQSRAMSADAKMAPIAMEAGTTTVTVDVSGSVQMGR